MLVPTMTPEEIHAELFKDAPWLQDEINLTLFKEYGKHVKRTNKFPDIKLYTRRSKKTQIFYYIAFFSYRRSEWDRPHFIVYTKYAHESGQTLIYIEPKRGLGIRLYTAHFLKRYLERDNERVEDNLQLANLDPALFFILRNRDVEEMKFMDTLTEDAKQHPVYQQIKEVRERTKFWQDPDYDRYTVACSSGVCLCERHKTNPLISIYDTFLSIKILKFDQLIDYIMAYSHLFLREMSLAYPRQSNVWGKEWNDFVDGMNVDDPDSDFMDLITKKIDDLAKRYPLYALL